MKQLNTFAKSALLAVFALAFVGTASAQNEKLYITVNGALEEVISKADFDSAKVENDKVKFYKAGKETFRRPAAIQEISFTEPAISEVTVSTLPVTGKPEMDIRSMVMDNDGNLFFSGRRGENGNPDKYNFTMILDRATNQADTVCFDDMDLSYSWYFAWGLAYDKAEGQLIIPSASLSGHQGAIGYPLKENGKWTTHWTSYNTTHGTPQDEIKSIFGITMSLTEENTFYLLDTQDNRLSKLNYGTGEIEIIIEKVLPNDMPAWGGYINSIAIDPAQPNYLYFLSSGWWSLNGAGLYRIDLDNPTANPARLNSNSSAKGYVDGALADAKFAGDHAICFGPEGNLYISETENSALRVVKGLNSASPTVETLAGGNGRGNIDGPGSIAQFNGAFGVCVSPSGKTIFVGQSDGAIRQVQLP